MTTKTKNIESIRELNAYALALFTKYDLLDWTFKLDNAKRRFGCCKHRIKEISMSKQLVTLNFGSPQIMDTLLHEIAHAIANKRYGSNQGHNNNWKRVCIEIGANPERCYDGKDLNLPKGKYVYKCAHCGQIEHKIRKPKRRQAHGKCCYENGLKRFDAKYELIFIGIKGENVFSNN